MIMVLFQIQEKRLGAMSKVGPRRRDMPYRYSGLSISRGEKGHFESIPLSIQGICRSRCFDNHVDPTPARRNANSVEGHHAKYPAEIPVIAQFRLVAAQIPCVSMNSNH